MKGEPGNVEINQVETKMPLFDLDNTRGKVKKLGEASADAGRICCTCPRNHCAKAYCKCFFHGRSCDPKYCSCTQCMNHEDADEFADLLRRRNEFIEMRRGSNPHAGSTCNCTRNLCSKKYCPCFRSGQGCHEQCNCQNCQNKFNEG